MGVSGVAAPAANLSLVLPPEESSAMRAQRFVRKVLDDSDVENEVINLAVLMTKALIINGLLHAKSDIAVTVAVVPDSIRIEVADETLLLVNGNARSWGVATISR